MAAVRPFLTNSMRENRLGWAIGHRYWGRGRWGRYLYREEKNVWTKNNRREEGEKAGEEQLSRPKVHQDPLQEAPETDGLVCYLSKWQEGHPLPW